VAVLPHAQSLAELEETWLAVCALMDGRTTGAMIGEKFVEDIEDRISQIAAAPAEGEPKPAIYLRMLNYTIATANTLEGELLERIGFINIAAGQTTRWAFDPGEAQSPEGRALFESVEMIFCDERDVSIKMLEQSDFYRGLNCVLKDLYIYIDCAVFERQSLRMLDQLELMATGK
ncbi:MAG: hypothetical protein LBU86_06595, partial [Oscillospiraceae bacterium]|jgi:hypothetical protein|nr:hypothetical protein [Oscillospiraceae bacterium]